MNLRRCCFLAFLFTTAVIAGTVDSASSPRLPFSFVENKGQIDTRFSYIGNGPDFRALFHDNGVVFSRGSAHAALRFVGASERPHTYLSARTAGKTNYLLGSDSHRWITNLPMYDTLRYESVWPGVNIRYSGKDGEAHADYEIDSIHAAERIHLEFDGKPEVQEDGSLVVKTAAGAFQLNKPALCLAPDYTRCNLQADFVVKPDGVVGFANVSNVSPPVDPRILFSGYFGGTSQTTITGVAINSYYNTVVTGWTVATDLPATGGAQTRSGGGIDAFVAAFSPAGGSLIYCTYLGGSGADEASGIAVDASNNTYITGWTSSSNFPVTNAIQSHLSGPRDAFVAKLNAAGNAFVYSTYLGGSGVDTGNAIALDASNSAVIIGDTTSANLPVTAGTWQQRLAGNQDVFLVKLTPAGSAVQFLTYLGGSAIDHSTSIALDRSGSIFGGGSTYSVNFPVVNAAQPHSGGGQDAWVAKFSADAKNLLFSTYLGGSGGSSGAPEQVNGIVVGPSGNIIGVGTTSSANFPASANAYQSMFGGGRTDGFIARVSGTSGALLQCSFLGGSLDDGINAVVMDLAGNVFLTGYTTSLDFPTVNPIESTNAGGMDAFVTKMNFNQVLFSTYLGGSANDSGNAIAIDSMASVVVAGTTASSNFPVAGAAQAWIGAPLSTFVVKIGANFSLTLAQNATFYLDVWHDTGYNGPSITLSTCTFGMPGDIPVVGDWDGSGIKKVGVFRDGTWLLDINNDGIFDTADKTVQFGLAGDVPIVGDWNGTGRIKLGLFRQGTFILDYTGHLSGIATGQADVTFPFGLSTDIPVVADWNRSGTSKVGVFRSGQWLVDYNGDQVFNTADRTYAFGQPGDIPVTGDWDSSGFQSKIGVYRNGLWILDYPGYNVVPLSGQWDLIAGFGKAGYVPLVR